jgi:hypothetical protein
MAERLVYNPRPERDWFPEGVTKGYLVVRDGEFASVAEVVAMTDPEGETAFEQTSEFQPARIVAD